MNIIQNEKGELGVVTILAIGLVAGFGMGIPQTELEIDDVEIVVKSEDLSKVYDVPAGVNNMQEVLARLNPGDTVHITEPKDVIKQNQAAPFFKPADNKPLNETQKAIKKAIELIIENEEKNNGS